MRTRTSVVLTLAGVLSASSWAWPGPLAAQTTTLRGRVVSLDGSPTQDARIRLTNLGELALFQSGEFTLEIPAGVDEVEVVALDPDTEIVYPTGGRLPIPRGEQQVTIVVGEPAMKAVRDALAERSRQLGQVLEANAETTGQLVTIDQSLRAILDRLDLREEDLRDEVGRREQRATHFPDINSAVREYILEARDLHDVLLYVGGTSDNAQQLLQSLEIALPPYNAAYQRIKSNAGGYVELIEQYWDGGERLGAEFEDLWEDGIEELHRDFILPMNEPLVVIQTQGGRQARDARRQIVMETDRLERALDALERDAEAMLATLAAN